MVKQIVSEQDKAVITEAVRRAETQTSGEIVVVLARQSNTYLPLSLGLAVALAWGAAFVLHVFRPQYDAGFVLCAQAAASIVFFMLLDGSSAAAPFIPYRHKQKAVRRMAAAQFYEMGLHRAADRAAIMIVVSLRERCIELLADVGIDARVPQTAWGKINDDLAVALRAGQPAQALAQAVDSCAALLAPHFPAGGVNDFPDAPVLLES